MSIMIKVLKRRKILWYTTWEEELHNNQQPDVDTNGMAVVLNMKNN